MCDAPSISDVNRVHLSSARRRPARCRLLTRPVEGCCGGDGSLISCLWNPVDFLQLAYPPRWLSDRSGLMVKERRCGQWSSRSSSQSVFFSNTGEYISVTGKTCFSNNTKIKALLKAMKGLFPPFTLKCSDHKQTNSVGWGVKLTWLAVPPSLSLLYVVSLPLPLSPDPC